MQDIITVAPDRKTAKGRFHGILLGGWHDDFQETREEIMRVTAFADAKTTMPETTAESEIDAVAKLEYEERMRALERMMKQAAKEMQFEKAAQLRDEISRLRKVVGK
jgi:excinuclease UvrABC helicase subunit UvrB